MKYHISHYSSSEQPIQVEEDHWEMQWEPEFWVVTMTKERDSDDQLMKDIIDYYSDNGVWTISNMIYFYKESDLTFFRLRWS